MSKYQAGLESSSPGVTWNKPDSNTTSNLQQLIQHLYLGLCLLTGQKFKIRIFQTYWNRSGSLWGINVRQNMNRLNNTSRKSHLLTGVSVSLVCLRMKYFHACRHEDSHTDLFQVNNQSQHFSEVLCKIYFGPKADLQKYNMCNHRRMRHHTESPVSTLPSQCF